MDQARKIIDSHGRHIHKLRVQLTDACNFRCFYCMPQIVKFLPSTQLLSALELLEICSTLVDLGIDEIRVSGGEPMLRKDFEQIIEGLSQLPLGKLGLTTNGFFLAEKLAVLEKSKCHNINISLDSLQKNKFHHITKSSCFEKVHEAVLKTKGMGFNVKINVVIMRGINDDEIFNFLDFSKRHNIEVRFLELMKIGCSRKNHPVHFMPAQEIIKIIEAREVLTPESVNRDSTSFNFKTSSGAKIGFIASESLPFCCFCSRLRLMATGTLRACLMSEEGVNVRGKKKEEYPRLLQSLIEKKPMFRIDHMNQPMYQIGG